MRSTNDYATMDRTAASLVYLGAQPVDLSFALLMTASTCIISTQDGWTLEPMYRHLTYCATRASHKCSLGANFTPISRVSCSELLGGGTAMCQPGCHFSGQKACDGSFSHS